jgi:toxin CcdB
VPYIVVLQSDVLRDLSTAIVAPIAKVAAKQAITRINIPVVIEGEKLHVMLQEMGAVPIKQLGMHVTNISAIHADVMLAVDLMFAGI